MPSPYPLEEEVATTPNNYITPLDFKAQLPDTDWTASYDVLLETLTETASRKIDELTGRDPGAYAADTDEVRYYEGDGSGFLYVDELAAIPTKVEMDFTSDYTYVLVPTTDYLVLPHNAAQKGMPYTSLYLNPLTAEVTTVWYGTPKAVKVTGKWGYSTVAPPSLKQAAIIQCIRWFKRAQQSYQDVGAIAALGQLLYVQGLDPDVQSTILAKYGRLAI